MKHFVIIVNGFQLLTIITKRSILDVAAVLDPPLKEFTRHLRFFMFLKIMLNACRFLLAFFLTNVKFKVSFIVSVYSQKFYPSYFH